MTDVTDILRDRMREPGGFQRMVTVSMAAHAVVAATIVFAPGGWLSQRRNAAREVMTISLTGGGEGPRNGGFTTIGGRPVQTEVPPEELAKREAVRPPAAKPEMTLPAKGPAKATKAPDVKQAPDQARGRTPTKGAKVEAGTAIAETGVRGQGFGLSTGGGPGASATLDVANFCCPDYVVTMVERIRRNWAMNQGVSGQVVVRFVIQRDGTISEHEVEKSSGSPVLDLASLRAVVQTRGLPPLPAQYSGSTLPVHLIFEYR
jgi:TonB family protein